MPTQTSASLSDQHTPGPWTVEEKKIRFGRAAVVSVVDTAESPVALITTVHGSQDVANARLIAAAPELLAAAQFVIQWVAVGNSCESAIGHLERAIAKTEVSQP